MVTRVIPEERREEARARAEVSVRVGECRVSRTFVMTGGVREVTNSKVVEREVLEEDVVCVEGARERVEGAREWVRERECRWESAMEEEEVADSESESPARSSSEKSVPMGCWV